MAAARKTLRQSCPGPARPRVAAKFHAKAAGPGTLELTMQPICERDRQAWDGRVAPGDTIEAYWGGQDRSGCRRRMRGIVVAVHHFWIQVHAKTGGRLRRVPRENVIFVWPK